jgi:hypothetical protein
MLYPPLLSVVTQLPRPFTQNSCPDRGCCLLSSEYTVPYTRSASAGLGKKRASMVARRMPATTTHHLFHPALNMVPPPRWSLHPFRLYGTAPVRPRHLVMVIDKGRKVFAGGSMIGIEEPEPLVTFAQEGRISQSLDRLLQDTLEGEIERSIKGRKSLRRPVDAAVPTEIALDGKIVSHNFPEDKEMMLADSPRILTDRIAEDRRGAKRRLLQLHLLTFPPCQSTSRGRPTGRLQAGR